MSYCDRVNCGYYYTAQGEIYSRCHCPEGDIAPCEYDDEPVEEEDDDPYNENDPYVVTNPMAFY